MLKQEFEKKNMAKIKNLAIIQARMGSSRLPNKVLADINGKTMLERILERLRTSRTIDKLIIATSIQTRDDPIQTFAQKNCIKVFRGSETNVLSRFYEAAKHFSPKNIIRICADNPLLEIDSLDRMVDLISQKPYDLIYNCHKEGLPKGTVSEVISFQILEEITQLPLKSQYKEHVTLYLKKNPTLFQVKKFFATKRYQHPYLNLAIDTIQDLEFIRTITKILEPGNLTLEKILNLLKRQPSLLKINGSRISK
ncbi:MAG: cytidylyltransferase domain-containing protein [Candidatus Hodarchaeales archaeon]